MLTDTLLKLAMALSVVLLVGYVIFDAGRQSGYEKGRALEANRRRDPSAYPKGSCQAQIAACTARGFMPRLTFDDRDFQCIETKAVVLP